MPVVTTILLRNLQWEERVPEFTQPGFQVDTLPPLITENNRNNNAVSPKTLGS
jgi:hypothetical protein